MSDEIYAKVFEQAAAAVIAARLAVTIAGLSAIVSAAALAIALWK